MTVTAVIGLGSMGPGIAATLARGGMTVRACDTSEQAAEAAPGLISAADAVLDSLGMPDQSTGEEVSIADDLEACVAGADLVIETVPEKLDLKRDIFRRLEALVSDRCVLASDTSGIPITKLQEGCTNPTRIIGMHWSNPPHIIPIVEVIAGRHTTTAVADWMVETIKRLNLQPVVVKKDVPGFVENRVLYALLRECVDLVESGVIEADALDNCVSWGIGYKLSVIGPMALLDMAGLDIYQAVSSYLNADLCARRDVSPYVSERAGAGRLGMKSGDGVYRYSPEGIQALRQERAWKLIAVRKVLEG